MERRVNYILVGVFSLVLVAGFVFFVLWAHNRGNGKVMNHYLIYFSQAINGLSLGGSVRYMGVGIGQVEAIGLDTSTSYPRVQVMVTIDATVPVVQGTVATLKPSGITGFSFIDLSTDSPSTVPLPQVAGSLPVIRSESSGFD